MVDFADEISRRKYYDAFYDMYVSEGWKTFINEMRQRKEGLEKSAVYTIGDEKSLYRLKGVVETLNLLLGHEQSIRDEEEFSRYDASDD